MTDDSFKAALDRMFAEAYERMAGDLPEVFDAPALTTVTVQKAYAMLPMSLEQLVDCGALSEEEARAQGWTPYVPPPVPWRSRLRWRFQSWRERTGRKVGGWIAGVDLSERDED